MKRNILLITLLGLQTGAFAQTTVVDSIQTGPSYANDVFYSFKNGMVKEAPNNEWQMSLSLGIFNAAVRTNATTSSSGNGSVSAYEMPGKDTSDWSSFDTTGYKTWQLLENSDEDWEMGALNQNSTGFDYGWGQYDETSHIVSGHRLYLFVLKNLSGVTEYRKVFIMTKALGTWTLKYANIDGSNEHTFTVSSSAYPTKSAAYINMFTHAIVDREPAKTGWDR